MSEFSRLTSRLLAAGTILLAAGCSLPGQQPTPTVKPSVETYAVDANSWVQQTIDSTCADLVSAANDDRPNTNVLKASDRLAPQVIIAKVGAKSALYALVNSKTGNLHSDFSCSGFVAAYQYKTTADRDYMFRTGSNRFNADFSTVSMVPLNGSNASRIKVNNTIEFAGLPKSFDQTINLEDHRYSAISLVVSGAIDRSTTYVDRLAEQL